MRKLLSLVCLVALSFTVITHGEDKSEKKTGPNAQNAQFEQMKKLAGTWVLADEKGRPTDQVASVVKVIAAGTVVHETLFPGQAHEMVSVYYLDGVDLVMTHFCALGNQPRMKACAGTPANQIRFEFAGGTNLNPARDRHMHDGTLTILDEDRVEWTGSCWENGKPAEGPSCNFKLIRKK